MDPRIEQLADTLIGHSVKLQENVNFVLDEFKVLNPDNLIQ